MTRATDTATARQFGMLAALLDHAAPPWRAGEVPPLGHWLLFPPVARQSDIGVDGHPLRADTAGLPRRMWAGGRVRFLNSVPLGAQVVRETEQLNVDEKAGRSGRMLFVTLRHRLSVDGVLAIEEEQDIVYREAAAPGAVAAPPAPETATPLPEGARTLRADPVQLFRFSALTFNGHRIHYDRDYAVREEGYPALVVHGPYIATLLMDHYLRAQPGAAIASFDFRAMRPIFDTDAFSVGSVPTESGTRLIAIDAAGGTAMTADLTPIS